MYKNDENRWLGITDHLVIDVIDAFVLDFGYDKKTVEKIFYKKHKLNDFDDLTTKEVMEIEDEVKDALGITESKKSTRKSLTEKVHKVIDVYSKNTPNYVVVILDEKSNSELWYGTMKELLDSEYRNFTIEGLWLNNHPDYDDVDCIVVEIDLKEKAFVESKSMNESKGSINFGDLLSSQIDYNKDDDNVLYYIFVNNKEYGSFFKWEIYNSYQELLQLDVFKWDIESKGVLRVNLH